MKHCSKCNQDKPYSEFSKSSHCKDGHFSYCKDCAKIYRKRYYPQFHKSRGAIRLKDGDNLLCSKCKQYLPPEKFYHSTKSKTGRVSRCRQCSYKSIKNFDTATHAKCTLCSSILLLSNFRVMPKNKSKRSMRCLLCENKKVDTGSLDSKLSTKYKAYYRRSKEKGSDFISVDQFVTIVSKPCHYCGTTTNIGIDRKDSNVGYTIENCLPSCQECNIAKFTMSYEDFIKHITSIYLHLCINIT